MKLTKLQKAAYLAQAQAQYENDEIEIGNPQDGGKNGLRGDAGMFSPDPDGSGSWVRAWVWVSQEEIEDSLPIATCFLDKGGYLSLSLRSEDPKQVTLEAAKELLEKAAAKRK